MGMLVERRGTHRTNRGHHKPKRDTFWADEDRDVLLLLGVPGDSVWAFALQGRCDPTAERSENSRFEEKEGEISPSTPASERSRGPELALSWTRLKQGAELLQGAGEQQLQMLAQLPRGSQL